MALGLCFFLSSFLFFRIDYTITSVPQSSGLAAVKCCTLCRRLSALDSCRGQLSLLNLRVRRTFTWTVLKTFPSHFLPDASFSCSACRRTICRNPELREFCMVIFFFSFCAKNVLKPVCILAYVCAKGEWRLLVSSISWILTLTQRHLLFAVLICLMQTGVYLLIHCGYTPVSWQRVKLQGLNGVRSAMCKSSSTGLWVPPCPEDPLPLVLRAASRLACFLSSFSPWFTSRQSELCKSNKLWVRAANPAVRRLHENNKGNWVGAGRVLGSALVLKNNNSFAPKACAQQE